MGFGGLFQWIDAVDDRGDPPGFDQLLELKKVFHLLLGFSIEYLFTVFPRCPGTAEDVRQARVGDQIIPPFLNTFDAA